MQGVEAKDENERTIVTYNPEEAIWYYISKLTHLEYVVDQLKVRISKQFFGLPLEKISQNKESYMKKLSDNGYSEIYTPITDDDLIIRSNAEAIIHTTKQAIEFYRASKIVSIYAKPILLYYCYMRLVKILFLATYRQEFKKAKKSKAHGLSMNSKAGEITLKPSGFFPRFQDSFYPDPSIYLDGAVIGWEDLLVPATQGFYLFDNISAKPDYRKNILKEHGLFGENKVEVRVRHSKYNNLSSKYMIHELTRELLFVYSMSHIARYDVTKWKKLIDNIIMWKIEGYLTTTQSFFPNLIFNELHGIKHFFYPESRMTPDQPSF